MNTRSKPFEGIWAQNSRGVFIAQSLGLQPSQPGGAVVRAVVSQQGLGLESRLWQEWLFSLVQR